MDPAEPIDKIDPLEPMLRMDPDEPIERGTPSLLRMGSFSQPDEGLAEVLYGKVEARLVLEPVTGPGYEVRRPGAHAPGRRTS